MNQKKVGRNDPCPCGSGKKYKSCCMGKEEKSKKTYTLSGKRKFKAKVIDSSAAAGQTLFSRSAGVPTGEGDPNKIAELRYRMTDSDYRQEEATTTFASEEEKVEPSSEAKPIYKPGETFHSSSDDFRVDEK